jgi:hypothetical protein
MRRLAWLIALTFLAGAAGADIVYLYLNDLPTVPGTGGGLIGGYTGAGGLQTISGTQTPIYLLEGLNLPPGTIVDVGVLTVSPTYESDQYGNLRFLHRHIL